MGRTPGPTSVTVRLADGARGPDIEVRFDPDAPLTAADLAAIWPGSSEGDLLVDGRRRRPTTSLADCGLADGAVVSVGREASHLPELVVVAGPLPPSSVGLDGPTLVGRGRLCDLRLDHPAVAPGHLLLEPDRTGWRLCPLAGTTLVDGHPVDQQVPLPDGATVSVGPVDLQVLADRPARSVPPPRAPVHRAARPPEVEVPDPGRPPEPPTPPPPPAPPGALTILGPVALGLVLAATIHPTAGLLSAGMPFVALGAHLDARRRHRRDVRRAASAHADGLAEHEQAGARAGRARADAGRAEFPTVVEAIARVRSGIDLWPVRTDGVDRLAVGWSSDGRLAPVVVDLGPGRLGIAGPSGWADAVERALVVQATTRCGPLQRSVPEATRWLPHAGTAGRRLWIEVAERRELLTDGCSAVLTWAPDGGRLDDRADGRRGIPVRPFVAPLPQTLDHHRTSARWAEGDDGALADHVGLVELDLEASADGRDALGAPLGLCADGPAVVDLVTDGPHALVAGTTGAGKSELLRTWIAALAARHPPSAVAFVLVDYKGGSAFDAVADLPHVTGVVTDLDPGLGARLLVGLHAEVREREQALRARGASDLRDLHEGPPRLVVIVDEFATLAAELPDFLGALVDVARRGRSLGVHLVLATQRPAGSVSDDIRANTALRICLRTMDAADSQDVLGDAAAASLPADRPGRAWIRGGAGPTLVQVATGAGPTRHHHPPLQVRRVGRPWPEADGPSELDDLVERTVGRWADVDRPPPTWLPPLPEHLVIPPAEATGRVVLGLVDRVAERRQEPLSWRPLDGHLVLLGGRRSGRTTAVTNVVLQLAAGHDPEQLHVHLVGGPELAPLAGLPQVGTVAAPQDLATVRRIVGRLASGPSAPTAVLVIDGFDVLATGADDLAAVRLLAAIDDLVRRGVTLVVTSTRPSRLPPSLLAGGATTVALRLDDVADAAVLGLRPAAGRVPPGRGRTVEGDDVQLVAPPEPGLAAAVAEVAAVTPEPRDGHGPPTIGPLPDQVRLAGLSTTPGLVTLGLRDRDGRAAQLAVRGGEPLVICGPPRSGRTTALDLVLGQLGTGAATVHRAEDDPTVLLEAVRRWAQRPHPAMFAIDDAERVEDPDGVLRDLVARRHPDAVVLVAVRTDAWRSAYGTWLAALRPAGLGIALGADPSRDAELWAAPLTPVGPAPPPGRALVVADGTAELTQVPVDG